MSRTPLAIPGTRVAKLKAGAVASVGRDTVERVGATPAVEIRKAMGADEPGVRACVDAAYAPYVERMGKPPAPMLDDYTNLIESEVVYVAMNRPGFSGGSGAPEGMEQDSRIVLARWQPDGCV